MKLEPLTLNGIVFRQCRKSLARGNAGLRHAYVSSRCDCLRQQVPRRARALSSGALKR
jgi:hypothetical protein